MLINLAARGAPFLGIHAGRTPEEHAARLRAAGWARGEAGDMAAVHRRFLDQRDVARAEALEPLDELEEWRLFQAHYALGLGVNDTDAQLAHMTLGL